MLIIDGQDFFQRMSDYLHLSELEISPYKFCVHPFFVVCCLLVFIIACVCLCVCVCVCVCVYVFAWVYVRVGKGVHSVSVCMVLFGMSGSVCVCVFYLCVYLGNKECVCIVCACESCERLYFNYNNGPCGLMSF